MTKRTRHGTVSRRRAISILASASAALPLRVAAGSAPNVQRWQGVALGADVSLELHGATAADINAALDVLSEVEARFSLFLPDSELSKINARGRGDLSPDMAELLGVCDVIHHATAGLFDPTIQPVFAALMAGTPPPWDRVGWDRVRLANREITLGAGQALTLNGIAQGHATDRVRAVLESRGLRHALVAVGEHGAIGGPFRLGLADPTHGLVGIRSLTDDALATSSPTAMRLGSHGHILHPSGRRTLWSTVSIEAASATVADALSTALCFASVPQVEQLAATFGARVTLVDRDGDLQRIG